MADRHFDLIVIGGGPAGYVGAIRAAQLGMKVACVERAKLGGVCLNWGCIPSKALLSNAELMEKLNQKDFWGLKIKGEVEFDWDKVIGRSRDVAAKLNKGIEFLFKKNKIEHIVGHAKVVSGKSGAGPCKVEISDCKVQEEITHAPATPAAKPRETITADAVLIATGSVARDLPFAKFDGDKIWGAREAMFNKQKPASLIIVGAGAIGMEFGYFYHSFGTKVTVIEMMDRILPVEDEDVSAALAKIYTKHGMTLKTGTTTLGVEKTSKGVKVTVAPFKDGKADESKKEVLEADKVLLAIGVGGRTDGLFDDKLGLTMEKGHIKTDYIPGKTVNEPVDYKTSIPGVYAVGDVIGPPWLAHVASEEAILCVERIAWRKDPKKHHEPIPMDYSVIPGCTYCIPQVASVGFTEQALKAKGLKKGTDYEVGKYAFQAHGKAIAAAHTDGFVKIIRGLPRGEILGAHIIGDQATELIAEMTLARRLEATTEELICTVHAHPTMHESIHEAALAAEGRLIHG
ncbi:MAG: dihydrolipoyl dehydrogenase [Phycisphaeraceae bacterium]|nr:dihydrolipoyl dehydrogenase [Phycisphaeraceae bacterium]MCW5754898.1 dihydrolipoyl dehydrogenase [Phycisphaeraceae bacterium]